MSAIILGHKHPDTDSIVSAIACTDLYRQRGLDVKAAARERRLRKPPSCLSVSAWKLLKS